VAYVYVSGQGAFVYMFWGLCVICLGWNACAISGQRAYMLIIGWGARIVK
jgi:hypothetical protein